MTCINVYEEIIFTFLVLSKNKKWVTVVSLQKELSTKYGLNMDFKRVNNLVNSLVRLGFASKTQIRKGAKRRPTNHYKFNKAIK